MTEITSIFDVSDYQFMARALQLAQLGLYTCDPNPRVGCVLVKNGNVIGEGWHEKAGDPHAEANAISNVSQTQELSGCTAFVTLEPCCHYGKTPPCTDALIRADVSRVVVAVQDPNPEIAGKGKAALEAAGIEVQSGLLAEQAIRLNPGHHMRMANNRPFVRLKVASSLDGRTALASGESQWISGKDARDDVQRLRARSSAIMTGVATVAADDPSLNVRIESLLDEYSGQIRQPLRVILDSQLRIPDDARLLNLPGDILVATTISDSAVIESKLKVLKASTQNIEIITLPADAQGRCDIHVLMSVLATAGINELHVECGPTLAGSLLSAQLIDELVCYFAPTILGDTARGLFAIPELTAMDQRITLAIQEVRKIGSDYRLTAKANHFADGTNFM